jgi:phosphate transport system permease protein
LKTFNKSKLQSVALRCAAYIAGLLTVGVLLCLVVYILIKGVPHLSLDLFSLKYTSENVSLFPALINTVTMTFFSLLIAVPLGIFSAIYLVEYARRGNKLVSVVRITAETLSGIPSIVYGLFGFLLFVTTLGFGYSLAH